MNVVIGKLGEKLAIKYLLDNNYQIIEKHFTTHWGEIDIIAKKNDIIYFIEVKTRIGSQYGTPEEAVNYFKLKSLKRSIIYYITTNKITSKMKLVVIAITLNSNLTPIKVKFYNIDNFDPNIYGTN